MGKSNLTDVVILTDHYDSRGGSKVDKITIHHMAGNLSAETCGYVFQTREASANYGIDTGGKVGCYVDEDNRAWSTANYSNDRRAINIELANDGGAPDWHVSDTAINKCIDLCVDICKRHGISRLNYTGDANGNLTRHNMFMATTCPGPYLQSKFPYIADEVNKRLSGQPSPQPTPSADFKIGDRVLVTGYATGDSYGGGEHTADYTGNPNDPDDIRYITLINEGAPRPYHISVGNTQGDRDRGWVSKDQIRKI